MLGTVVDAWNCALMLGSGNLLGKTLLWQLLGVIA
jgi:hypothetical protein